jgi:hypothetical protein
MRNMLNTHFMVYTAPFMVLNTHFMVYTAPKMVYTAHFSQTAYLIFLSSHFLQAALHTPDS